MNTEKENIINNLERVNDRIKEVVEELKYTNSGTQWRYYNKLKTELKSLKQERKFLQELLERL